MDMVFHIIYTLFLVSSCAKLSDIWYSSTVASTSILCCDVSDVCHLWCFFGSILVVRATLTDQFWTYGVPESR